MDITRTLFEQHVPAFKEASDRTFLKMQPFIRRRAAALTALTGITAWGPPYGLEQEAARAVCLAAAREAVPQLDLVLTPTGFGVVSNQQTAPASRERVSALAESLRRDASLARDLLLHALLATPWAFTPEAGRTASSLMWCPMLARRYGIRPPGAQPPAAVYDEEYRALKPAISAAEESLRALISPELHERLLTAQRPGPPPEGPDGTPRRPTPEEAALTLVAERSRRYMALLLTRAAPREADRLAADLLDTVRRAAPEAYEQSATAAAQRLAPHANRRRDPTFFFG